MLSGARKPLAAGCAFNKSNKAFIWLAACSLGLDWPGTHYLIQAPHRCPGWGVGGGGGQRAGSAEVLGEAEVGGAALFTRGTGDAWGRVPRPECWSQLCHQLMV